MRANFAVRAGVERREAALMLLRCTLPVSMPAAPCFYTVAQLLNLPKVLPKPCCMPVAPSFSHLCQEYATWVIRLCLPGMEKDVCLIWYANPFKKSIRVVT